MLKKTLIAIAILCLAVPAFGGTAVTKKIHQFTKAYEWGYVGEVNVCLDVGYWIQIDFRGKCIEVQQNSALGNPFESYSGCLDDVKFKCNFDATLKATASSASPAGGNWSATLDGGGTYVTGSPGTFLIDVCVAGVKVKIDKLIANAGHKQTVAVVTVWVLPTGWNPAS
jgi:hypothetical protein